METKGTVTGNDVMGSSLRRGVEYASVGAHDTINQISAATAPVMGRLASNAHHVVDTVVGVATNATETLGIRGDQLNKAQEKFVKTARTYLRDKPFASVGIAVAAIYVLRRLLFR